MPSVVAGYLSIIIGALMTLVGGAGVAFRLAGRFEEKTRGAGTSFVMATLGVVCIFYGDVSTNIIGVSWGLLGLYKVAGEYDEVVAKARRRKLDAVQLLLATAELGLSLLLIVNPLGSMEHHVVVLGIELILYPFKLHRDNGRLQSTSKANFGTAMAAHYSSEQSCRYRHLVSSREYNELRR